MSLAVFVLYQAVAEMFILLSLVRSPWQLYCFSVKPVTHGSSVVRATTMAALWGQNYDQFRWLRCLLARIQCPTFCAP
jgi:hypothetical protein